MSPALFRPLCFARFVSPAKKFNLCLIFSLLALPILAAPPPTAPKKPAAKAPARPAPLPGLRPSLPESACPNSPPENAQTLPHCPPPNPLKLRSSPISP